MKRKPKHKIMNSIMLSCIPLLLLFLSGIPDRGTAQQVSPTVICTAGETLFASSLSLDFTVGEIATESLPASGLLLTQGFNQGFNNNMGIEENSLNGNDLIIYPNPASGKIFFSYTKEEEIPISIKISDLQGRCVLSINFDTNPVLVHLDNLTPGFYTASILFDNQQVINKKIIKQ